MWGGVGRRRTSRCAQLHRVHCALHPVVYHLQISRRLWEWGEAVSSSLSAPDQRPGDGRRAGSSQQPPCARHTPGLQTVSYTHARTHLLVRALQELQTGVQPLLPVRVVVKLSALSALSSQLSVQRYTAVGGEVGYLLVRNNVRGGPPSGVCLGHAFAATLWSGALLTDRSFACSSKSHWVSLRGGPVRGRRKVGELGVCELSFGERYTASR
jgi:hypothetical protein